MTSQQVSIQLRNSLHCMEAKGSLLCAQKRNTCTYHEPKKLVHAIPPYVFKIYFNNIIPPMPECCKWFLYFSLSNQMPAFIFFPILMHATCPAHLNLLDVSSLTAFDKSVRVTGQQCQNSLTHASKPQNKHPYENPKYIYHIYEILKYPALLSELKL